MEVEVLSMAMVRRAESDTPRQEAVKRVWSNWSIYGC